MLGGGLATDGPEHTTDLGVGATAVAQQRHLSGIDEKRRHGHLVRRILVGLGNLAAHLKAAAVDGDHGCAVAQLRWRGPIASLFEHETGAPEGQSDDDDDDGGGSHGRTSGCGWVRIENPVGTAVEKRSASTPWFTAVLVKVKVCVEPPSL